MSLNKQPAGFEPTPDPVVPLLTVEQEQALGLAGAVEYYQKREEMIAAMNGDPFRNGYVLPCWTEAEALFWKNFLLVVFGGNGAAKTFFSAWLGVRVLVERPDSKVLFLHESERTSVDVHHAAVYRYLPREWREVKRGRGVGNVKYEPKNGFSDHRFVLPNGSICQFGNYGQDIKNYEGTGWTLVAADEKLPLGWLKTLLYRLPRKGGRFLWTYTPIDGMTPAIKEVVTGATTVSHKRAELLPGDHRTVPDCPRGTAPYVQKSATTLCEDAAIIYFFSEFNPYSNYEEFKKLLSRKPLDEIERRAYGLARNVVGNRFPKFGGVNIVPDDKVPKELTRYRVADPSAHRNMFVIWWGVDARGYHYIYREWPGVERYGWWAETDDQGKHFDGKPGPGQNPLGLGVKAYKRMMLEAEGHVLEATGWKMCGEKIALSYGDPRAIKARSLADEEGGSSLMERFLDVQRENGVVVGPLLDFLPAPGLKVNEGIEAINELLDYDQEEPITAGVNEPRLYVAESCKNVIWALSNWTEMDGEHGACKDPVDCVRYGATAKLKYMDPKAVLSRRGGAY